MISLPWIALVALFLVLRRARGLEWKQAAVYAQLIFFFFIAVSTEAASVFNMVQRGVFVALWVAVVLVLLCLLAFIKGPKTAPDGPTLDNSPKGVFEWLTIIAVCGILCITLLLAVWCPPNNVDSMTYHMTKVAHWIQDGNIRLFATSNGRQNYYGPLGEYTILHFQLLAGSDRFANTMQWMTFVSSIIAVCLLIKEFGGKRSTQFVGALLAATIPMAIQQSSSTQTDLVTSFFVLAFTYFVRRLQQRPSWENTILCGLSLGLGIFAKGTFYFLAAPIGALFGIIGLWKANNSMERRRVSLALSVVLILGAAINAPLWHRTYEVYGNLFPHQAIKNQRISLGALWSIGLRNIGSNLNTPRLLRWYSSRVIQVLVGKNINDPATTFQNIPFDNATLASNPYSEDYAGNLIHLGLAFVTAALLLWRLGAGRAELRWYAGAVFVGALLISLMLKWNPWGTRYELPLFFMAVPFIAIVLWDSLSARFDSLKYIVLAVAVVWCVPYIFKNPMKPIIARSGEKTMFQTSRDEAYFIGSPNIYQDYTSALGVISKSHPETVGLYMGANDPEYPIWVLSGKAAVPKSPTFMHVGVTDRSARLQSNLAPDFIFVTHKLELQTFTNASYKVVFQGTTPSKHIGSNIVQVLQRESVASAR